MELHKKEKKDNQAFHAPWYIIFYKMSLGLIELSAGVSLVLFGKRMMKSYLSYSSRELSEDPHDIIIRITERIVPYLFAHNTYLVLYLIVLGSAKIAGSVGLIYKKNWGVDLLVILTFLMLPFQVVNLLLHASFLDFSYITLGLFIAFYLIEFNPKAWVRRVIPQYIKRV